MRIAEKIGESIYGKVSTFDPWGHTLALSRTALVLAALLTLLFNDSSVVFRPIVGSPDIPSCIGASKLSIFCLFADHLELARWISIAILLVTLTGFYPAFTCILHWWVSFSFISTATIVDGGDQVASVLTLLLIPICLLDKRKNHWHQNQFTHSNTQKIIAFSTLQVIKIQVAFIYFQACVSKLNVSEWVDGTAVYYWFLNPMFGVTADVQPIFTWVLSNPIIVVLITWSALLLEFMIFVVFTLPEKHPMRKYMLIAGLAFHFFIMSIHGLVSFFFSMAGALIIYLLPTQFNIKQLRKAKPKTVVEQSAI